MLTRLMPPPTPLTLCEAPQLDWSRPAAPAAANFGDIYFSVDGGLDETRTVFLNGCGLPEGWQNRRLFTIGELGFGSGLNFLAAWQMWEKTKPASGRLHFISIEKFPFDRAQLSKTLSAWPELKPFADQLIKVWPGRVKGFHRLHFGDVTLTLIHDDIISALDGLKASVNAWFLDGFSPSKNPAMWSVEVMAKLAAKSAAGARLATFTVAGSVRQALSEAGFAPNKKPGFGKKRERLEAYFPGTPPNQTTIQTPTILGAGIGGASLAAAFKRRGITPNIISRGMDKAASGNPAAIIKPRLDLQDRPESRFFLSAFLYDQHIYEEAGSILRTGIRHIPKDDKDRERFEKITTQRPLPHGHLTYHDHDLTYETGMIISPKIARDSFLAGCGVETMEINSIDDIQSSGPIIVAAGFGVRSLIDTLGLRYSRGQLTWAQGDVDAPLTYGGYVIPLDGDVLVGATHDRLGDDDPFTLSASDDDKNLRNYHLMTGHHLHAVNRASRASVRVNTADTLPRALRLESGQWVLTGLGSRGFVFAPLLAEAMVSEILGEPSPLDVKMWARLSGQ